MALSKIKANSITDDSITVDQIADTAVHGRRNLLINGAMQVAQRATSETGQSSGGYGTVDRFKFNNTGRDQHVYTEEQSTDAPDGFSNSFKITTTTVETAIDADDAFWIEQLMEGQDVQHLKNGSSGAVSLTLSFYVKSSQTGTFGVNLYKGDNTGRVINATYTISSANTWEYKTITFPGDTSGGGIVNDNTEGLRVVWHLASGSNLDSVNSTSWANYSTTNWAGGHAQDGVITTLNATWQVTGCQLEVGDKATPFEHRSYGEESALCYRYFYRFTGHGTLFYADYYSTDTFITKEGLPVEMRVNPTVTSRGTGGSGGTAFSYTNLAATPTLGASGKNAVAVYRGIASSARTYLHLYSTSSDYSVDASAEL